MEKSILDKYEMVIGLEVHAQLQTNSKAYCSDGTEFGLSPNVQISPISLGHPGTLPVMNEQSLNYAIKMGIATNCNINRYNAFARKNYFYADLPKGYQITQHTTPICTEGKVKIKVNDEEKYIGITRIHLEEDAGKSIHDIDPFNSLIDLNRAGVPLIEIVTEPDLRSADDAYEYLTYIRKLVRYLDICDGNMEEGSLRCDCNISVRLKGAEKFGTKVEVKNMNSIRNVKRAIEFEFVRQVTMVENNEWIEMQTRSFNAADGSTFDMRSKEAANDYRYFPEPDLPPVILTDEFIAEAKAEMPALPEELIHRFKTEFGLNEYDANVLADEKEIANYYLQLISFQKNYKSAANWLMVGIKGYLNEKAISISVFPIQPQKISELIDAIDGNKISNTVASQKIFPALIENPTADILDLAKQLNVLQESDASAIEELVKQALAKFPEKIIEYKNGKTSLQGLFVGEVMKLSKGKAEPKIVNQLVNQYLNN
ncbi:MAG: Asp-tRNA(Asn)/Glu-tRNA(Gln) amidotransferase subunit GatB [Bacteroidota bacterium]|jgi:aspartyl-tRNA(Asn)/glutamyl-tRNA(Gln) amidotransferase subunit B